LNSGVKVRLGRAFVGDLLVFAMDHSLSSFDSSGVSTKPGEAHSEAKILCSWINATQRELKRRSDIAAHETQRLRDLAPSEAAVHHLHGPVKASEPQPLAHAVAAGVPLRIEFLEQRRLRQSGSADEVVPAKEPEAR